MVLKGSSDAHFPQVDMILNGLNEKVYNILWLKFLNGSVKQHPFYLAKMQMSSADPAPLFRAALWESVNFSHIHLENLLIRTLLGKAICKDSLKKPYTHFFCRGSWITNDSREHTVDACR